METEQCNLMCGSPARNWRRRAAERDENASIEKVDSESQAGRPLGRPEELSETESLILAQNERWRHGLGMQVERGPSGPSGERVSNT